MKKRTLDEYRQTKEHYIPKEYHMEPVKRIMAQQIDEETEKVTPDPAPFNLEDQIQEIASKVLMTVSDEIFHAIIEEMSNYDELNWGWFVQDDAPTTLLNACFDHKNEIHYEIFQLVLQKLK